VTSSQQAAVAAVAVTSPRTLRRDRWAILTGLSGITAAAWIYLVVDARRMSAGMTDHSMTGAMQAVVHVRTWTATEFGLRLAMWAVMMVAMMVPTATPMTLVYAAVARKAAREHHPVAPTFVFIGGYLAIWALFSVAATAAQRSLEQLALLSPTMVSASPVLGSALLLGAGVYQLTPYKHSCLTHCRAPAHFISQHWRPGFAGAFRMGLEHGAYCLGCCWILMALLFVGGVMNLVWIAAIAIFILLEKTMPFAETGARVIGAAMTLVGLLSLTGLIALG
jgi:predicted metal-binding membrane protein